MDTGVIQQVKSRLDIVEVVRRYVQLKPVSGRWMGPCPFHQETKPSFSVNGEEGFYYCFGCQAAGDVINFYQRVNGLEFGEALEQLAAEAGVELRPGRGVDREAEARSGVRKAALRMHELAGELYRRNLGLAGGAPARDYLKKRGLTDETVVAFGLGYSLDDWRGLLHYLEARGFGPEQGAEAGLLVKNEKGNVYDRFRGRLMFPIVSLAGKVIAFGGRALIERENDPKYLNSSDSPIYKKGEHLYGLYQARGSMAKTRRALLTEGYMDVLSMHQFGYRDACGVLGTALTPEQVKRLSGFCSRVDLVFDGDAAGRKAALRSAEMLLVQGVSCRVVLLPEGEDVDSLLQGRGRDGFEVCLGEARDGFDHCMRVLREGFAPREVVAWAEGFLKKLPDPGLVAWYLPRLAEGLRMSEAELRQAWGGRAARPARREGAPAPALRPVGKEDKGDKYFLSFAISHPEYVEELGRRGLAAVLTTEFARVLWGKLSSLRGQDPMPHLDDRERSFYVFCRQEGGVRAEDLGEEWAHICRMIGQSMVRDGMRDLKESLRLAQEAGDQAAALALLRRIQELKTSAREDE